MAASDVSDRGGVVTIFDSGTPATGSTYSVGDDMQSADWINVVVEDVGTDGNFDIELVDIAPDGTALVTKCFESHTTAETFTILNIPRHSGLRVVLNSITAGTFTVHLKRR